MEDHHKCREEVSSRYNRSKKQYMAAGKTQEEAPNQDNGSKRSKKVPAQLRSPRPQRKYKLGYRNQRQNETLQEYIARWPTFVKNRKHLQPKEAISSFYNTCTSARFIPELKRRNPRTVEEFKGCSAVYLHTDKESWLGKYKKPTTKRF